MKPPAISVQSYLKNSQTKFYALDLSRPAIEVNSDEAFSLKREDLARAESDGTIQYVASTYIHQDNRIKDTLTVKGPRVITFAPILKYETFPLAKILEDLLDMGKTALGTPVEIEFAIEMPEKRGERARFDFLQIRPMAANEVFKEVNLSGIKEAQTVCRTSRAMGNGVMDDLYDLVYIDYDHFDVHSTRAIASEIEKINGQLSNKKRPYILIGFGRWATSDPFLGIPVQWNQISGAKVFVEVNTDKLTVEPSQGSHFFQNMLSLHLGYFFVDRSAKEATVDWQWLKEIEPVKSTRYLRHLHFKAPLRVMLDGRTSNGVILKPDFEE